MTGSRSLKQLTTWLVAGHGFDAEVAFRGLSGRRRFRFDFGLPDLRIGVDYHGHGESDAAHNWRASKATDYEKVSEASLCGWVYVICDATSVQNGRCGHYIDEALRRRTTGEQS